MTNGDMEGPFDKRGKTTEAFISPFPPIFQLVRVISFPLVAEDAYLFIVANNVFCVHSILVEVEWTQLNPKVCRTKTYILLYSIYI